MIRAQARARVRAWVQARAWAWEWACVCMCACVCARVFFMFLCVCVCSCTRSYVSSRPFQEAGVFCIQIVCMCVMAGGKGEGVRVRLCVWMGGSV